MSGITGFWYLDGRYAEGHTVSEMLSTLAHRGPDGEGAWHEGSVGLGHRALHTTPESVHECQPVEKRAAGLILSADARIDNREDLIRDLGLRSGHASAPSDADLIVAAYERWGDACPSRLIGDFAFAIWDIGKQRLFCARDHAGVRPLYYHHSAGCLFAFASEPKALFELGIPRQVNERRIGAFLALLPPDPTSTFFRDVSALAPGHALTVDRSGLRISRYWTPELHGELKLGSSSAYADAFLEVFQEAVRCRLRSVGPVAAYLSGGLDSSAIACTARRIQSETRSAPLHTLSFVYDELSECDERSYIEAVLEQGGYKPHQVIGDNVGSVHEQRQLTPFHDGPLPTYSVSHKWSLLEEAKRHGVRVVLDGHGGDEVVSHGTGYVKELAMQGRWLALAREIGGLARTFDEPPLPLYWGYISKFGLRPGVPAAIPLRAMRKAWRILHGAPRRVVRDSETITWKELVRPGWADQLGLPQQYQAYRQRVQMAKTEREAHVLALLDGAQPYALETLDKTTAAVGIEPRYPFWDRRVVEFCLRLPAHQKLRRGWGRSVLRRSMEGILPEPIRWRRDKTDFYPQLLRTLSMVSNRRAQDALVDYASTALRDYVDPQVFRRMYVRSTEGRATTERREVFLLCRTLLLALWMQQVEADCRARAAKAVTEISLV